MLDDGCKLGKCRVIRAQLTDGDRGYRLTIIGIVSDVLHLTRGGVNSQYRGEMADVGTDVGFHFLVRVMYWRRAQQLKRFRILVLQRFSCVETVH